MTFWIALGKIRPIFQSWNSGFGRHSIRGFRNWKCDWDWNPSSGMLPVLQRLGSALLTVSSYFRLSFRRFRLSLDCLQNVYRMLVVIIHLWSDFNVVEWCERKHAFTKFFATDNYSCSLQSTVTRLIDWLTRVCLPRHLDRFTNFCRAYQRVQLTGAQTIWHV